MTLCGPLPWHPELDALLRKARTAFAALTPEQRRAHLEAQRRSWCVGETMLAHPEMSREQAEQLYDSVRSS